MKRKGTLPWFCASPYSLFPISRPCSSFPFSSTHFKRIASKGSPVGWRLPSKPFTHRSLSSATFNNTQHISTNLPLPPSPPPPPPPPETIRVGELKLKVGDFLLINRYVTNSLSWVSSSWLRMKGDWMLEV
ncbi:hypothetical protein HMI55_006938 [Coelomomyces lativittatus]|nr:hypothetical protein HMI55_006938 [Coelomomyces lativittatus]